ncbi:hypothetical protein [Streptomyces sp. NPDC058701]|uniref:hypothetical protein n=1 Tax=Streptomyces sp. NPDC058701 TaxID=3346608 RepID=UPI0036483C01
MRARNTTAPGARAVIARRRPHGASPPALPPALALLGRGLADFPRAAGMLRSGSARLTSAPLTAAGIPE